MGNWDIVYEIALIVWIIFGLGYIFMVINIIAENLRKPAKRVAAYRAKRLEERRIRRRQKNANMFQVLQEVAAMKVRASPPVSSCFGFASKNVLF